MAVVGQGKLTKQDCINFALDDPLTHLLPNQWYGVYGYLIASIILYETNFNIMVDFFNVRSVLVSLYYLVIIEIICIGITIFDSVRKLKWFPNSVDRRMEIHDDGIQLWITEQALYPTWTMHWSEVKTLKVLRTCIKIKHIHHRTFYIPLRFFATEDIEWIRNNLYAVWQEQRGKHVEEPEIQPSKGEWLLEGKITLIEYLKTHYQYLLLSPLRSFNVTAVSLLLILMFRTNIDQYSLLLFGIVVFGIFLVGFVLLLVYKYFWYYKWIGKIRAVVSPEVITVQRLLFDSKNIQQFTWKDMYSIHQTKKTVRIILHSSSGVLLPLQNLSSSEREELIPLFTAKQRELEELQKKQRKQKKK